MKPDYDPNPYVMKRPRRGLALVAVVFALVILGAVWAYQRDGGEGERVARTPAPELSHGSSGVTGTSGQDLPREADANSGPAAVVPPAIIQELETITGRVDGQELIGRRVDLHVRVQDIANDTAFWVGEGDNRLLVVMGRDNRNTTKRAAGVPAAHGILPANAGQQVAISGSVQRLPKAEEMYSWQLTRTDAAELADRKFYIRADSVMPNGHSTN
jgi:hypothetical protein